MQIRFSYTTLALRKWYFKNPHPKRPQFASEFPWLVYPGWHCCAVPMAHHPPTIQSSWAVQTADAFRCSTECSYEPWLEHRRLRLLPAGHTFVAERCIQPHFGCSSQLGEYPAMTLSRSSALGKRHESGFALVNSGP